MPVPRVDFARRNVVALVAHYDGDDVVVTHGAAGRPSTVHVALPRRHDANPAPRPAALGVPDASFWSIPRLAGPARLVLCVLDVEEAHPLPAWK